MLYFVYSETMRRKHNIPYTIYKILSKLHLRTWIAIWILLIVGPIVFVSLFKPGSSSEAAWFDPGWSFRQRINIPSHTSTEPNVYVTVPSFDATDTTRFQSDCGDLRFTKENGQLLKYYVVDCDATATIHVLFDTLPAGESNYYMYYGNPSAPNDTEPSDFAIAATGLGSQAAASEEAGPGPTAYWKFDEGQGTTVQDATTNNNDGSISGATWQTNDMCITGKCLFFDGSSADVDAGSNSSLDLGTGNFTISLWAKIINNGNVESLIAKSDNSLGSSGTTGFDLIYRGDTDSRTSFRINDGSATADTLDITTDLADNRWHNITISADRSGNAIAYIDGIQKATTTISDKSGSIDVADNLHIGTRSYSSTWFYNGFLDEVKIYSYTRSAAQVKSDYLKGAATMGSSVVAGSQDTDSLNNGLTGYWKMDESSWTDDCSTASVTDSSGNGNNGKACPSSSGPSGGSTGKFGYGGHFDGNNDVIQTDSSISLSPSSGITVAGWVKMDNAATATSASQGIVDKGDYQFYLDRSDGKAKWVVNDAAAAAFSALTSGAGGISSYVSTMLVWNNTLYIGGNFTDAGGDPDADYIAMWDGSNFSWPTGMGLNARVNALTVWNNNLYVGGSFSDAGGDPDADLIARWDGSTFSWPTGMGLNTLVNTLIVWNGDLYVGGGFSNAGGDPDADYIAMWDGSNFSWPTGQTPSSNVNCFAVWNSNLYVGGVFSNAGGDPDADRIAEWDGSTFSWPTGMSLSSNVYALAVGSDNNLYVGGAFANAGGDPDADRIAKWDGSTFSWPTGQTPSSNVTSIVLGSDNNLYMGGYFLDAGGDPDADRIALWDGSSFSWPTGMGLDAFVNSLVSWNGNIYVGGVFKAAGGDYDANFIALWDGSSFSWPTSSPDFNSGIGNLAVWNGNLYLGGAFTDGGGDPDADNIAMWDGSSISWPTGMGLNAQTVGMAVYNNNLIIGGVFTDAGGDPDADHIAIWDGSSFSWPTGMGLSSSARVFTIWNNELYVGGDFVNAGGDADADYIAKWDGSTFSWPTGQGLGNLVSNLTVWDGNLYVGGDFVDAGGDPDADRIAKWDGSTFSWPTGQGLGNAISGLTVWDGNLYVGGSFSNAGGDPDADNIAKWDGSTFSWPTGQGLNGSTYTMTIWNGDLYVGGSFTDAGGDTNADYIAKWDGSTFSWVSGQTLTSQVSTMATLNGDLYIGGTFDPTNTHAHYIAKWGTSSNKAVSSTTSSWTENTWYHVAGTFDGEILRIFVNGQLQDQVTNAVPFSLASNGKSLLLGSNYGTEYEGGPEGHLMGNIDDMRIYNRGLSPNEVQYLYNWGPAPIGYWKLDEGSGTTTYDSSGNGLVGTLTNNPVWTTGKYGKGLQVSNTDNSYVAFTGSSIYDTALQNITVSIWYKELSSSIGYIIGSNGGAFTIRGQNSNPTFQVANGVPSSQCNPGGTVLSDHKWHFLTETYDGTTMTGYIDGIYGCSDTTLSGDTQSLSNTWNIGARPTLTSVNGIVDDTIIYNYVRSPSQIIEDMNAGPPVGGRAVTSKFIDYNFNEMQGQIVHNLGLGDSTYNATLGSSSTTGSDDPTWTNSSTCKDGGCVSLDGSQQYIALPNDTVDSYSTGSFCSWIYYDKPTDDGTQGTIFSDSDTAGVDYKINFYVSDTGADSAAIYAVLRVNTASNMIYYNTANNAIARQQWTHVCFVQPGDGNGVKLYINGRNTTFTPTIAGTATNNSWFSDIASQAEAVTIGDIHDNSPDSFFTGKIDNFHFYSATLTEEQVKVDMNAGATLNFGTGAASESAQIVDGPGNPPVVYWNLDEKLEQARSKIFQVMAMMQP